MVGFDAKNKNILDKKFICPKCSMILRDPVQLTNCGHRICQSCLPEPIITVQCSQCRTETSSNNIKTDRALLNSIQPIPINCSYCEWIDVFRNYQAHLDQDHFNSSHQQQPVEDMQYVSYDGTLIWKISNVQEKIRDAQSERQTSIYSPPFYSSPIGYKMRARLHLNGDGNARRTHMSLFFVLMRGPHDAILKFPFNHKVIFCLYDQTPQLCHVIDLFRPDAKSNSFQRPVSEMNNASGIPKFFPLAMIQQEGNPYVRDDTMFIKVMIDFNSMENSLLQYTLSLNPGLPSYAQQILIQRELERRLQKHGHHR